MAAGTLAGPWIYDSAGAKGIGPVDPATGNGKGWRGSNVGGTDSNVADGNVVLYDQFGAALLVKDDAAVVLGTQTVVPVGFLADETATDSVDEGDIGLPRMTLNRIVQVNLNAKGSAAGDTALQAIAANADMSASDKILEVAASLFAYNGTNPVRVLTADQVAVGNAGTRSVPVVPALANALTSPTFDPQHNNVQGTVLASAARTASTGGASVVTYNARYAIYVLNITAASGTGGLQLVFRLADPISGSIGQINDTPTAIVATGLYVYILGPGLGGGGFGRIQQSTQAPLPRTLASAVLHGDASSYTYSVGYFLGV